jgi:ABC-type nitrate/sulfonate/bicarbonate transport system permease component
MRHAGQGLRGNPRIVQRAACNALLHNGSGRLKALLYGALPESAAELMSYTVYRWECAIRGSVVMGFVGAGGLGQRMDESMKMMAGNELATMLMVFVLLVAPADRSAMLRRRLAEESDAAGLAHPCARALVHLGLAGRFIAAGHCQLRHPAPEMGRVLQHGRPALHARLPARLRPARAGALPDEGGHGHVETLAMSAIGTVIAAVLGALLALPASGRFGNVARNATRGVLNVLRSIPNWCGRRSC